MHVLCTSCTFENKKQLKNRYKNYCCTIYTQYKDHKNMFLHTVKKIIADLDKNIRGIYKWRKSITASCVIQKVYKVLNSLIKKHVYFNVLYSSSFTASNHSLEAFSAGISIAR